MVDENRLWKELEAIKMLLKEISEKLDNLTGVIYMKSEEQE